MGKEGSEAGNYYNQSTIHFIRDSISVCLARQKFDVINIFSEYLCLYTTDYFHLPQNNGKIKKENIKIENNIFKVDEDLELKNKDIIITQPPYSYYKKDDKFIIQIEYFSQLEGIKIKKIQLNEQYIFNIAGKVKKKLNSNLGGGEFYLSFPVPRDFVVFKSNQFLIENNEKYGIINIIYDIDENSYTNDESDELGGDDDW